MVNQRDAGLLICKPLLTPIDNHANLSFTRNVPFTNVQAYKRLIERLSVSLIPE